MKRLLLPVLALLCSPAFLAGQPIETPGDIEAVTVYRGQALVTRRIEVNGPAGLHEVVVTELPEQVVAASLYAEATGEALTVRSVRYRTRPVEADVREEVRAIDEQIEQVQDRIKAVEQQVKVVQQQQAYLDKLATFTAATADTELSRGILNADTLTTLTQFQFTQRETLATRALELELQQRELGEQLHLLRRQRGELAHSSARTAREAVVFVDARGAGDLLVRYLVNQAGWTPSYNVRADDQRTQVTVEYYASVRQMSGEDWSDVTMTLSTATPSLAAAPPDLAPMTLALIRAAPPQATAPAAEGYAQLKAANTYERLELERQRGQRQAAADWRDGPVSAQVADSVSGEMRAPTGPAPAEEQLNKRLNQLAGNLQLLEIQAGPEVGDADRSTQGEPIEEAVSVTYRVPQRTSLPSRNDQQLIQIASLPMPGEFYRVATPVLTPYVYEQASVKNASDRVLLAGPVSAYVAGQFVGRGSIPTVAVGEPFTVGFGIDPSLRAGRELVDKDEAIRGGNRVMTFDYKLTVQNFGSEPVTLRLKDRIPAEDDGDQFTVELVNTEPALSEAGDYLATERDSGILRWDIEAPAGATGADAAEVTYTYTLAYDRQMTISGLPVRE